MADEKVIKDAMYRKNLSISWFNATNSAIEMVKLEFVNAPVKKTKAVSKEKRKEPKVETVGLKKFSIEERLDYWRNFFLGGHKEYYATVIAQVGSSYDPVTAIERIKATTTREELKTVWISLSEDERHDKEIKKVVQELKKSYEKA